MAKWYDFLEFDEENYFELVEALYTWLILNHSGENSVEYELQCRIVDEWKFNPGPCYSESKVEKDNFYYPEINEENFEDLFNDLETFIWKRDQTILSYFFWD